MKRQGLWLRFATVLALAAGALAGCESTRVAVDYDAPINRSLAETGEPAVEMLIEVDREGRATILDVTGVSPGTRASDIEEAYKQVARITYPAPPVGKETYQSKTLVNPVAEKRLANPVEERKLSQHQDQESFERQMVRPAEFPPIGRPGTPQN